MNLEQVLRHHVQVCFSLRNNASDLVIRIKQKQTDADDSEIFELISHEKLEGDLPAILLEGYAHWLNLSTSILEIRSLSTLWETSSDNWKIDYTPGHYCMWKGPEYLLDVRSQSWEMVASLFKPLCTPQDLIVSALPADTSQPTSSLWLSVYLLHYDLSFYVDGDGDLQCRSIPGMVYDENQYIGSLFGLVNRLVLRSKIRYYNTIELIPRCVLIPDGEVSLQSDSHHIRVEISCSSGFGRVTYQTYQIDTDLGRLMGGVGLTSKLYCAYLHALTSRYSTDPLTGRSGTEEALSILHSGSCWSTVRFGPRDAQLLTLIASICIPEVLRSRQPMQEVKRCGILPLNLQNHELYILSEAIKEHYERVVLCYEHQSTPLFKHFPSHSDHSPKRAAGRARYLFPYAVSKECSRADLDARHSARDLVEIASGEHRAYTAATYVYHRTAMSKKDIWKMMQSWESISGGDTALSLQYDRSWLAPDLPLTWLKTYNLLRKSGETKWFQLLFSLPAMAYALPEHVELVHVFIAFAVHSQFCFEDPPDYLLYPISQGCYPSVDTLRDYVLGCAHPFVFDGEEKLTNEFERRQREMYNTRLLLDTGVTVRRLLKAWPCEVPPSCSLDPNLYAVETLESKVQSYFSDCFCNLKLQEHLTRVQTILDNLYLKAPPCPDTPSYSFNPSKSIPSCILLPLTIERLFSRPASPLRAHDRLPRFVTDVWNTSPSDFTSLRRLLAMVEANAVDAFQRKYSSDLRTSAQHFGSETSFVASGVTEPPTTEILTDHYARCRAGYAGALRHLQQCLGPRNPSERAVELSGQWPCITAQALFRCLASNSQTKVPDDWKRCLITFTLVALELQRARRLLLLHFSNVHEEFCRELRNEGCEGWNAETHPDWLLIQVGSFCYGSL